MLENQYNDIQIINDFVALLNRSEKQHCELFDRLKALENEQSDILHNIEFSDETSEEIEQEVRRVRRERRIVKNLIQFYFPIKDFSKKNPDIKQTLEAVVQEMQEVKSEQDNRYYKPRVRQDMEGGFKHFPIE